MAELGLLIKAWDEGHRELAEAFIGLQDEDVWTRPHPKLLSVGEIAGHIAHWDAVWIAGSGLKTNLADLPIQGPLIDPSFRYYTTSALSPVQLEMGAKELWAEVDRVHKEARAIVIKAGPDSEDIPPGYEKMTWGGILQYRAFHVAYHTGQIYSVRHLLGHETVDN